MTLTDDDRRIIAQWAADCAERALPIFAAKQPSDPRPQQAIEGIRAYVRDGKRTARLRSLSWVAHAAARQTDDLAAKAAARSASLAAATAYTHALATVEQAKHILGPAVYAALARESLDGACAGEKELQSAIERASQPVREILRRFPPHQPGRSRLATLYRQLDAALRDEATPINRGGNSL